MSHASPRDASGWGHAVRVLEHRGPLFFSGLAETPERRKRFRLGSRTGRESFSRARVCWIRGSTFQPPEAEHTHIHERERNRASRSEAEGTRPMRRASPVERGVALGLPARRWVCRCSNMEEPNRRACARSGREIVTGKIRLSNRAPQSSVFLAGYTARKPHAACASPIPSPSPAGMLGALLATKSR